MGAPQLRQLLAATLCAGLTLSPDARADDEAAIDSGSLDYEAGRYVECVQRFQSILKPGSPDEVTSRENRSRARMYLAACLVALRKDTEADTLLDTLIREDIKYAPTPASFSGTVIDRFRKKRTELRPVIEAQRAEELQREALARQAREEQAQKERERQAEIERMAREQLQIQKNSRLVALLPFGIGQLQNRQNTLGWGLLGAQAAFAAVSVVSYYITLDLQRQFSPTLDESEALRLRDSAVLVNRLSFGAFALLAAGGIVHAQLTFVPEFSRVHERPLPPPVPPLAAAQGPSFTGGTLLWSGRW